MIAESQSDPSELIIKVDKLQDFGINAGDISKLKAGNILSIAVSIFHYHNVTY